MSTTASKRSAGLGRVLVLVYAVLAIAATGRSIFQLFDDFDKAPVAYSLSALAAVIYIVATAALVIPSRAWYWVAIGTITFELLGVLIVGTLSIFDPVLFPEKTVWSFFGRGYAFVPLVLPVLGLIWLRVTRARDAKAADAAV
jgi:hypothetical protein